MRGINKLNIKKLKVENNGFSDLSINVLTLGSGSPKIAVLNGLHGLERTGAYLMPRIVKNIKMGRGSLTLIPFANPTSAARNTRLTPEDNQDLNRLFPGNKNGTLSFRIADVLFNYLKNFDLVIDVHTFPKMDMPIVGVFFSNVEERIKRKLLNLIRIFGPDYIWSLDTISGETVKAGSLIEMLLKAGVMAFSVEAPDVEIISERQEDKFVAGIQNIVNLFPNVKSTDQEVEIPIITREPAIATASGFFVPKREVFQNVRRGDAVGEIRNLDGFKTLSVRAPVSGPIVFILKKTLVSTGDRVVIVGNIVK
jgi:predicted deacylase